MASPLPPHPQQLVSSFALRPGDVAPENTLSTPELEEALCSEIAYCIPPADAVPYVGEIRALCTAAQLLNSVEVRFVRHCVFLNLMHELAALACDDTHLLSLRLAIDRCAMAGGDPDAVFRATPSSSSSSSAAAEDDDTSCERKAQFLSSQMIMYGQVLQLPNPSSLTVVLMPRAADLDMYRVMNEGKQGWVSAMYHAFATADDTTAQVCHFKKRHWASADTTLQHYSPNGLLNTAQQTTGDNIKRVLLGGRRIVFVDSEEDCLFAELRALQDALVPDTLKDEVKAMFVHRLVVLGSVGTDTSYIASVYEALTLLRPLVCHHFTTTDTNHLLLPEWYAVHRAGRLLSGVLRAKEDEQAHAHLVPATLERLPLRAAITAAAPPPLLLTDTDTATATAPPPLPSPSPTLKRARDEPTDTDTDPNEQHLEHTASVVRDVLGDIEWTEDDDNMQLSPSLGGETVDALPLLPPGLMPTAATTLADAALADAIAGNLRIDDEDFSLFDGMLESMDEMDADQFQHALAATPIPPTRTLAEAQHAYVVLATLLYSECRGAMSVLQHPDFRHQRPPIPTLSLTLAQRNFEELTLENLLLTFNALSCLGDPAAEVHFVQHCYPFMRMLLLHLPRINTDLSMHAGVQFLLHHLLFMAVRVTLRDLVARAGYTCKPTHEDVTDVSGRVLFCVVCGSADNGCAMQRSLFWNLSCGSSLCANCLFRLSYDTAPTPGALHHATTLCGCGKHFVGDGAVPPVLSQPGVSATYIQGMELYAALMRTLYTPPDLHVNATTTVVIVLVPTPKSVRERAELHNCVRYLHDMAPRYLLMPMRRAWRLSPVSNTMELSEATDPPLALPTITAALFSAIVGGLPPHPRGHVSPRVTVMCVPWTPVASAEAAMADGQPDPNEAARKWVFTQVRNHPLQQDTRLFVSSTLSPDQVPALSPAMIFL